jgi:hypothetical protein
MLALQDQGYATYLPFSENTRCDLIVDYGGRLSRVQCKTGRLRGGSVLFAASSTYGHHPNPKVLRRTYEGEIDEFAVYCPELGSVYLIPIAEIQARNHAVLRVDPPKNGQTKKVRWASTYEIARVDVY